VMAFYASLLRELKELVAEIDNRQPWCRELVWEQLFTIVGTQRNKYSGFFTPVLTDTMKEETVKLMDMEVLFLSFFLVLNSLPNLFFTLSPPDFMSDNNTENLRALLRRNAQDFFSSLRVSLNHYISENDRTRTENNENNPIVNQLHMLEIWSKELNNLPTEKKIAIWETCGNPKFLENYVNSSTTIEQIIKEWSLNFDSFKQTIKGFYECINSMRENGVLNDRFQPPTRTNQQDTNTGIDNITSYKKALSAPSRITEGKIPQRNNQNNNNKDNVSNSPGTRSNPSIQTLKHDSFRSINSKFERMGIREQDEMNSVQDEMIIVDDDTQKEKGKLNISNLLND